MQLAVIEKVEVEPLAPEVPFGRLQDASGVLEITAPSMVFDSEGDEDKRGRISDIFSKGYGIQGGQDERSMLLDMLRTLARGDLRDSLEKKDTRGDKSPVTAESLQNNPQKEKYKITEKVLMLILFGKRDSIFDSGAEDSGTVGEKGDESWRFWGLILEPARESEETGVFQRTLPFAKIPFRLKSQNIAGFQKEVQRSVRII